MPAHNLHVHPLVERDTGRFMHVRVDCRRCDKAFRAPEKLQGTQVKCPSCGNTLAVPAPEKETSPFSLLALADSDAISEIAEPINPPLVLAPPKELPPQRRRQKRKRSFSYEKFMRDFSRNSRAILLALATVLELAMDLTLLTEPVTVRGVKVAISTARFSFVALPHIFIMTMLVYFIVISCPENEDEIDGKCFGLACIFAILMLGVGLYDASSTRLSSATVLIGGTVGAAIWLGIIALFANWVGYARALGGFFLFMVAGRLVASVLLSNMSEVIRVH